MSKPTLSGLGGLAAVVVLVAAVFWIRVAAQPERAGAPDRGPRITAAEGFTVEEVYGPEASGSVVMLTFDSEGHLVVARERGPVVRLIDRDEDGRPDEEQVVTDAVTNAQGLLFDGADLLVVGNGPDGTGLYRVTPSDGDDETPQVTLVTESTSEIQEHGPHTVFFGPDGYLYWMLGNHTRLVPSTHPLSPHRDWIEGQLLPFYTDARGHASRIRAPGGTVVRRDLEDPEADWEDVAGGFRNAYDAAFNLMGELFTFDSDMEWDLGLPWFRPVRTNHVVPGGEYGWRTGSGKWPDYYPDSLPGMSDVGRGSPVGVVFYQSGAYPERYHDAALHGDWSRGRVLLGLLERSGATYAETLSDFVAGTPLNVTGVDVGPDGHVYFAKGGRNTEGGIYRVVHRDAPAGRPATNASTPVERALAQWQPRSSWGRAAIAEARAAAGEAWGGELAAIATSTDEPPVRRVRALELLQVYGPAPDEALLTGLGDDAAWEVRAGSTYYLGLHPTDAARAALADRLGDEDPFVRRRAAEALVRTGVHPAMTVPFDPVADLLPLLDDDDRYVRYAARALLERTNRNRWREAAFARGSFPGATEALLALVRTTGSLFDVEPILARQAELLEAGVPDAHLPAFLRVVHLAMIQDEGVAFPVYAEMAEPLLERFPAAGSAVNREIARTLAYVGGADAVAAIVDQLSNPAADREDQIFYAYCLRAMSDGWDERSRGLVVEWFTKTQEEQWRGGASFVGFLELMWNDFAERLPEDEREAAREAVGSFRPEMTRVEERRNDTARFSEQELTEYLLWDPMAYTGDAERGAEMYEKALCASCHRFGDRGFDVGPDLTDVARRFERADVLEKVLYPSRTISDQWAAVRVVTRDDRSIVGVVSAETADTLTLLPADGVPVSIAKPEIVSRQHSEVSAMPEGLLNALSLREISDLFAFLEAPPDP